MQSSHHGPGDHLYGVEGGKLGCLPCHLAIMLDSPWLGTAKVSRLEWLVPRNKEPIERTLSYLPLGNGGKATDFSFLSSAADRQFLMVSSSCSSHLSEPHWGM